MVVGPALEIAKTSEPETVRSITSLDADAAARRPPRPRSPTAGSPGEPVTIAGATPAAYNGTLTRSRSRAPTTFTYAVPSTTASPATGTITATGPTVRAHPERGADLPRPGAQHRRRRGVQRAHRRRDPREHDLRGGLDGLQPELGRLHAADRRGRTWTRGRVPAAVAVTGDHPGRRDGHRHHGGGPRVLERPARRGRRRRDRRRTTARFVITVTGANTFTYAMPRPRTTTGRGPRHHRHPARASCCRPSGPGEDIDFRFQVRVNAGTAGPLRQQPGHRQLDGAAARATRTSSRSRSSARSPSPGTSSSTSTATADAGRRRARHRERQRAWSPTRTATSRSSRPTRPATGRRSSPPGTTTRERRRDGPGLPASGHARRRPDGRHATPCGPLHLDRRLPAAGPRRHQAVERRRDRLPGPARRLHRHRHQHHGRRPDGRQPRRPPAAGHDVRARHGRRRVGHHRGDPGDGVPRSPADVRRGGAFAGTGCTREPDQRPGAELLRDRAGIGERRRRPHPERRLRRPRRTTFARPATSRAAAWPPNQVTTDARQRRQRLGGRRSPWSSASPPNCATDPNGFQLLTVENVDLPADELDERERHHLGRLLGDRPEPADAPGRRQRRRLPHDRTTRSSSTRPATRGSGPPARTRSTGRASAAGTPYDAAATVPVMVVQWGAAWNVQRTSIVERQRGRRRHRRHRRVQHGRDRPGAARADVGLGHRPHQRPEHRAARRRASP